MGRGWGGGGAEHCLGYAPGPEYPPIPYVPVHHVAGKLLRFTRRLMAYSIFLRTETKEQTDGIRSSRRKREAKDTQTERKGRMKN